MKIAGGMTHGLWSGNISFGLVNIPVSLKAFETHNDIHFHLLDKKDKSPIKYKTVNGSTQKEVPRSQIGKGYEYKKGNYVFLEAEDFKRANVKATKTIDLQAFVDVAEVNIEYFEKPNYILPHEKSHKSYALLREALRKANKVGIAMIVIATKQHLCAVLVRDNYLVLELLRFTHELKVPDNKLVPPVDLKKIGIKPAEIEMAERLIEQMTAKFEPDQYKDEYQNDLLKFIKGKIKHGAHFRGHVIEEEKPDADRSGKVIDFMSLLKRSVEKNRPSRTGKSHLAKA